MNLDRNSSSAQDKPSSHPSDTVLAPSLPQTDLLPAPHKAASVSTESSISHSQVKQDNESNTKDSGFRKMNDISSDNQVESIENNDETERTKIDVFKSLTLPPSTALDTSPNISNTPRTTPRRHGLKRPSKLTSARSVPYSSRSSRIRIRPSTPPTPTPASKKPISITSGLLALGYKPQNNPDSQDEFLEDGGSAATSQAFSGIPKFQRGPLRRNGDPMPFDLYDHKRKKYRSPTEEEVLQIHSMYPMATEIVFRLPVLVIACPVAPNTTPLTVGGVPTVFVPKVSDYVTCPGQLGNPTIKDPLSSKFKDTNQWDVLELIYRFLEKHHPMVVATCFRNVVVSLHENVDIDGLPGVLGGRPAYYTVGDKALETIQSGRSRLLRPQDGLEDTTNYIDDILSPGVLVSGRTTHSSAGVLLERNNVRRLTVANHGFGDSETNVYHPLYRTNIIARLTPERYAYSDVALCELAEGIRFSNQTYFDAPAPRRLVLSDTVESTEGWCWCDGATTGAIPFLKTGFAYVLSGNPRAKFHELKLYRAYNMTVFGSAVGDVAKGLCGSPVVMDEQIEDDGEGDVLGFFRFGKDDTALVPVADSLINAGWQVAAV